MAKLFASTAILCLMTWSAALAGENQMANPATLQTTQLQSSSEATNADLSKQVVCTSSYHNGDIIKRPTCLTRDQRQFNRIQEQQHLRDIQTRSLTINNW